jgi:hypothetical protein
MYVSFYVEGDQMVLTTLVNNDDLLSVHTYGAYCSFDCVVEKYTDSVSYVYSGARNDEADNSDVALIHDGHQCVCGKIMSSAYVNSPSPMELEEL